MAWEMNDIFIIAKDLRGLNSFFKGGGGGGVSILPLPDRFQISKN